MLIDCGRCPGRGRGCEGCLIKTLAEVPEGIGDLTPSELRAVETFELAGFDIEILETPEPPVEVPFFRPRGNVA